ncbi:MAG: DUF6675 family protein [Spirochaetia bacterium]
MRFSAVAIQMLLLVLPLRAEDALAPFVGSDTLVQLRTGAAVKAGLAQDATLSLVPNVSSRDTISAEVKALAPSVGAELLRIIPGPGITMDAPAGQLLLFNSMHSVSTMKGVTYWSVTRAQEHVLFVDSYAISSPEKADRVPDPVFTEIPATHELYTFQEDSSFGRNTFLERFFAKTDHLYVKMENLSTIRFLFIPFIQPQGLVSQVVLVPAGTDVLFYGVACIRTGMPIGDKSSRVQSMENRLVALAGWLEKRLSTGHG